MELHKPSRWEVGRIETVKKRIPLASATISFTYDSPPNLSVFGSGPPAECLLSATDQRGLPVSWFTDEFFKRMLEHWGQHQMVLRLQDTPGAILHRKILERMNHVRTEAPSWHLIAETSGNGIASTPALDQLLTAPYHEICFRIDFLPPVAQMRGGEALFQQRVFHAMQKLITLRVARGLSYPKITWIFLGSVEDENRIRRAEQIARQLCVDRFISSKTVES